MTEQPKNATPIHIHIDPPKPEVHPCLLGMHRWAYLTAGGQACGYCGKPR